MGKNHLMELVEFRNKRMSTYAQKPNEKDRKIDEHRVENPLLIRNEFSKDRDRIKFSRAFRRLEHKAQIYSHEKGDHFRTRLTHTLEVSQIGRSLARNLNLNEDLVEAITLGHDIGHTPFGHQGERVLDDIMSGKDDLSGKINCKINYGGFKHNFNSVKILDQLEVKFYDVKGMNLTWQVLEGVLKHTKIRRHKQKDCKNCNKCWDIAKFVSDERFLNKYMKYPNSVTLEGQIVAIADEIAQRQHDVDDGLRDLDVKLDFKKVADYLIDEFEKIEQCSYESNENLNELIGSIKRLNNKEIIARKELYKTNQLVSNLIDFFIKDVTLQSLNNLYCNIDDYKIEDKESTIFTKKLIYFSPVGEKVNVIIENYIKIKILNSYNVNRFDGKSIYIIRQLFKAYYTNPRQMPKYVLKKLSTKINTISDELYHFKFSDLTKIQDINFIESTPDEINKLVCIMKMGINTKENESYGMEEDVINKFREMNYINEQNVWNEQLLNEINTKALSDICSEERVIKALIEIHYAYLSGICDYIAGMTDNFASSEFKKLYLVQ